MSKLTPKQEKFCREVVSGKSYISAYRAAYNTKTERVQSISEQAYQLSSRLQIASRINELQARLTDRLLMSRGEWLEKMDRMAGADMRKVFDPQGNVLEIHAIEQAEADCIQGIEVVENFAKVGDHAEHVGYTKKIKFTAKRHILKDYGQARGWLEQDEQQKGPQRIFIRKWVTEEVHHVHTLTDGNAGIVDGMRDDRTISAPHGGIESRAGMEASASNGSSPDRSDASAASAGECAGLPQPLSELSTAPAPADATPEVLQHDEHGRGNVQHELLLSNKMPRRVVRRTILPDVHDAERNGADNL